MVLWIFVVHDPRLFCYIIYLTLLWANEPIQGLACHIEATVFSEPGSYSTVLLIPMYKCKHIQKSCHNGSSLLGAKNIKCSIKFVRDLITKFSHNKIVFNWKIAENKNILGIV